MGMRREPNLFMCPFSKPQTPSEELGKASREEKGYVKRRGDLDIAWWRKRGEITGLFDGKTMLPFLLYSSPLSG